MIKNRNLAQKRSRKNLNDLIGLYEINYLKIIKLFPIHKMNEDFNFLIPEGANNSEIKISIDRKSRHTSKLTLYKSNFFQNIEDTEMEIYVYHDARMAEVRRFNGMRQFWLRNKYPNKYMLAKDEKFQWNIFLSEFLNHSQLHGLSIIKNMH
ncbi:MAG: hypothetical protein CMD53_02700 [Gammaproteobacteria bacterium]|jgi:hypothetical protein|nr:hypothetical protein [Gammaproteobacteria bacterium]|tara:strand:+ start:12946 stop:13401 length:456 start_codon:yes stop_codon:yes gene_type:complete